jgi:hypothetical protein
MPASVPAVPRVRPVGMLMAAVVMATLLGLAYLTQTLGSNATSVEIRGLEAEQRAMEEEIRRHQSLVLIKADDDKVQTEARRLKLSKLPKVIVLEAP